MKSPPPSQPARCGKTAKKKAVSWKQAWLITSERAEALEGRLDVIAAILEGVDQRCMAADGPVSKTRDEITGHELRSIYRHATRHRDASRRSTSMTAAPSSEMARALEMARTWLSLVNPEGDLEFTVPVRVRDLFGLSTQFLAAHASLEALQRERDDGKMVLRAVFGERLLWHRSGPRESPVTFNRWLFIMLDGGVQTRTILDDDGTGLPILTDEARRALEGNHK